MGSGTSNNQINNYRMKTLVDERIRTEPCESKAFSPWEEMQVQRIKVNPKTNLLELVRKKQRRPFQEYRRTNLIDMFKPKQQIEVSVDQMLTSSRGPSLPKRRSLQPQQTLEVVQTSKLEKSINEEGNSQINQYTVVGTLGQGSFGKVKQAQNYKGELFAIKIANKKKLKKKLLAKSNAYSMLEREIAIMKKICHPNVVQLFEVIDDPDQDKLYLVMEYMGKGSILSKGFFNKSTNILDEISPVNSKNQLNETKCRHYFRQFILGLDYLHEVVNVIHRDIKPENLLVSNDDVLKIADFGVSHIMEEGSDGKISNQTGTQSFLAPEAFKGSNFDGKPVDVWAGGVTLYQMIYNKLPFPSMKPQELRQQILEDKFYLNYIFFYKFSPQFKVPQGFSPSVISLLKGMLEKNPAQRLTVEQIMEHEWLTEYGQQPLLLNENMEFFGVTDMEIKLAITTLNVWHSRQLSNYFIWQGRLEKQQHQRRKIKLYMDHKKKIPEDRYKLEIFVKAQNLVDLDTFSKSDPYCKLLHHIQGEEEIDVGNTEWLKNNLSPQWETTFVIDYIFELSQKLTFQVWDHNGGQDSLMGKVSTTVADIVGCKDMKVILDLKTKDGKPGGQLLVNIDKQIEDNQFLQLQWIGQDLMNTDGYFGKSDPFLKFYKKSGDDWLPVHKTEMIKDDLNPVWKPFQISVKRLCGSNLEQQFKVECWDVHNKGFNNQYMGKFYVSVHDIINENKTEFNLDYKNEKSGGKIILKDKRLIKRPTFMDFLKDGEQINLIIAVDYTAQNGNQNFGDSLHAILQNGQLNQYETAIKSCAQILLNYDYDKKVALYGFGCIPHLANYNQAETEQCFPLTGDFQKPEVYGLDGIMNLYKQTLPNLQFSGPAQLNPIIEYAKQIAEYNKKKRIYTALLILTCGEIHDLHKTSELLSTCATVPLSVILVGVGDFEFKKLELLDQEQKVHQKEHITRDVVQFVPFAPNSHSLPILQRALLAELPHQLVQYKSLMGLVPQNY